MYVSILNFNGAWTFYVLKRRLCLFWYFTIVFEIFLVTVSISHPSFVLFVAISFDSVMLLFQGHVACQNFTSRGPPYCVFLIGSFTCT